MAASRYRESRTLVRRLCRLPHQPREEFRHNISRLRKHFERFNVDVSEVCQWLMGLRKRHAKQGDPADFGVVVGFLLEPVREWRRLDPARWPDSSAEPDDEQQAAWRLAVFDDVAGFRPCAVLGDEPPPATLREAMDVVASEPLSPTAQKLFDRLRGYDPAHRFVLLKSAAEWIVARYRRPIEFRERELTKWQEEKEKWKQAHPELTPEMCEQFTAVFKSLVDPDRKGPGQGRPGIRKRNPRICLYERLKQNKDNCACANRGHGTLCWKYAEFVKLCGKCGKSKNRDQKPVAEIRQSIKSGSWTDDQIAAMAKLIESGHASKFNPDYFPKDATEYLESRIGSLKKPPQKGTPHQHALERLFRDKGPQQQAELRKRFKETWQTYLKVMGLNDDNVVQRAAEIAIDVAKQRGRLPHCTKIGKTGEETACVYNVHTGLCRLYREQLEKHPAETRAQEKLYREFRKRGFHVPPRRPSFRYPSARDLPTPKIFGEHYFDPDFEQSVLRLRLDDMPRGKWLEFGFIPWPRDYDRHWAQVEFTGIHLHFVGAKARAGFRFAVSHAASRFGCTQDEIDDLRSHFRRQTEDQAFLDAARQRLRGTLDPALDFDRDLRVLAVDLGEPEGGAYAAVYQGHDLERDFPLEVLKLDYCYPLDKRKQVLVEKKELKPEPKFTGGIEKTDARGLRQPHVERHVQDLSAKAKTVAEKAKELKLRSKKGKPPAVSLRGHDYRRLQLHTGWMIRDWVRVNAARIVQAAEEHNCDLIVFESLRDWRAPGYDELEVDSLRKKRWLAMFAYGRIRRKVSEKAVERGLRVVTLPYHKSSQTCSVCRHLQCEEDDCSHKPKWRKDRWLNNKTGKSKENKGQHWFRCVCNIEPPKKKGNDGRKPTPHEAPTATAVENPGRERCRCTAGMNSDANAARVLARVFWDEIRLPPPPA